MLRLLRGIVTLLLFSALIIGFAGCTSTGNISPDGPVPPPTPSPTPSGQ